MRIVCWQTILINYQTLFISKIEKDVAKFVVCCSRNWGFNTFTAKRDCSRIYRSLPNATTLEI